MGKMTLVGLEPTISGSVDRCLIHWATGPSHLTHLLRLERGKLLCFGQEEKRAHRGARTHDHKVKSLALYQLS